MAKKMSQSGIALILTILLMTMMLFLSLYLFDFSITEHKISQSQSNGTSAYYLAEAGIQEMIWRIKNDPNFKNNFETIPNWTASFTRNQPFGAGNGQYTVTITNSGLARGEIISTGSFGPSAEKTGNRVVRVSIFKPNGESAIGDNSSYGNHDITISNSHVNFINGGIYANHDLNVKGTSIVNVEKNINTVHKFDKAWNSTVNVGGKINSSNFPPAADPIRMPAIDFDSKATSSYKNRATIIYSDQDFKKLLEDNQTLILNDPIVYVEKDVELKGGQNLTINGLLVIGHDITIGNERCWKSRCGYTNITINHTAGTASGILAKHKIEFKEWTGNVVATALIYSSHELTLNSLPTGFNFNIIGGLVGGHDFNVLGTWREVNITKNNEVLNQIISDASLAPIITINHWEEEY